MDVASLDLRLFQLHPLGFYFQSQKQGDGVLERIHVWPGGPGELSETENEFHNHSFSITSQIVVGQLRNEIYQFVENASGEYSEFAVEYPNGKSVVSTTGKEGSLNLICSFQIGGGESYFLAAGLIHRIVIVKHPCITVLETVEKGCPIRCYGMDKSEPQFERRFVNDNEFRELEAIFGTFGLR